MGARETVRVSKWRTMLALILLSACSTPRPAIAWDDEQSPRRQEWVEIKSAEERVLRALVVYPQTETPERVVVILHENRGLTSWERSLADQLAAQGYVAIAPDLLSGVAAKGGGTDSFETGAAARAAIYDLKPQQVLADLDGVFDYASQLRAGKKKLIVVGFCWGGAQAFHYAAHNRDVAATAIFCAAAPSPEQMKRIQSPVYGFYGENDARVTGEVSKVKGQMLEAGRQFEAVTYAGASHSFFRLGEAKDASPADRTARSAAWLRLLGILEGR